ncbi:MAG: 23S rRNA (pseudouridine(1915)-N(3))-methyltransferase RlmH [Bacteroidota bacterium]
MKISFFCTGKDHKGFISEGIKTYRKRLGKYVGFEYVILPEPRKKSLNPEVTKGLEADIQLKVVPDNAHLILLDERGKFYDSIEFSQKVEQFLSGSVNHLAFLTGGAYGFHEKVYQRANSKLSLSKMTFSHQLIRLMFLEQLYRAFTIIHNEPYHNA